MSEETRYEEMATVGGKKIEEGPPPHPDGLVETAAQVAQFATRVTQQRETTVTVSVTISRQVAAQIWHAYNGPHPPPTRARVESCCRRYLDWLLTQPVYPELEAIERALDDLAESDEG